MGELIGCAICGAAMADVEVHTKFHQDMDAHSQLLHQVEGTADEAERKADYATNVLYNRGLD
ncbi:MAG: hypothetical protein JWN22_3853 [Nocardioides sp.]|jgi:hypothetical protein|nr:hypothetical protein [Nocardioides sp.]